MVVSLIVCVCVLSCFDFVWPYGCTLPGSSVHGILQARILERVDMPSSRGSSQPRDWTHFSYVFCTGQVHSLPPAPSEKPGPLAGQEQRPSAKFLFSLLVSDAHVHPFLSQWKCELLSGYVKKNSSMNLKQRVKNYAMFIKSDILCYH